MIVDSVAHVTPKNSSMEVCDAMRLLIRNFLGKIGIVWSGVTVSDVPIIIYLLLAVLVAITSTEASNNDYYNAVNGR